MNVDALMRQIYLLNLRVGPRARENATWYRRRHRVLHRHGEAKCINRWPISPSQISGLLWAQRVHTIVVRTRTALTARHGNTFKNPLSLVRLVEPSIECLVNEGWVD
jgi:hypothetical protein